MCRLRDSGSTETPSSADEIVALLVHGQVDDADEPAVEHCALDDVAREVPAPAVVDDRFVGRRGAEAQDPVVRRQVQQMANDRRAVVGGKCSELEDHALMVVL